MPINFNGQQLSALAESPKEKVDPVSRGTFEDKAKRNKSKNKAQNQNTRRGKGKRGRGGRGGPAAVQIDIVKRGSQVETVQVYGRVIARQSGDIAARTRGAIGSRKVRV